jgi:hypothetical protein
MDNEKKCPCGAKIIFVKEETEDGEVKVHPLDLSSPVYEVTVDNEGRLRTRKAHREVPGDPYADPAYLVSHFRTCSKVGEFRKARKDLQGEE